MHWFLYTELTLPQQSNITIRPLSKLRYETELFPLPQTNCFPVLPANLILPFCKKAKKRPALMIQSADYPLWDHPPVFMSEQEAIQLAIKQKAKLFYDTVSESSYFCYIEKTQHIVWIEDGFHLQKKLKQLQESGIQEIAFPVFPHNLNTINLLLNQLEQIRKTIF